MTVSVDQITPGGAYASPLLDDLRQDKDLRNSFLNALALSFLVGLAAGLYYVYSILEPFVVPLAWALLSGILLHPYKRALSTRFRQALVKIQQNDLNVGITALKSLLKGTDKLFDLVGENFLSRWREIGGVVLLSLATYFIYLYTPHNCVLALCFLRDTFLVTIPDFFASVQTKHVVVSSALFVSSIIIIPHYKVFCILLSSVTWLMAVSLLVSYLWPPLVYLLSAAIVAGYISRNSVGAQNSSDIGAVGSAGGEDEADGEGSRVHTFIIYILKRLTLIQSNTDEVDSKQTGPLDETRITDKGPAASTPLPGKPHLQDVAIDGLAVGTPKLDLALGTTPNFKIVHPGVSALKKEHGILANRPNISEIGKNLGSNTPRSRLGRSFRYNRRKSSLAEMKHDSMRYIYLLIWCCLILQLWLHPQFLVLIPFSILYSGIKRTLKMVATIDIVRDHVTKVYSLVYDWYTANADILFPYPVRLIASFLYSVERSILKITTSHVDNIVTIFLILAIVMIFTFASIFISIQVYAESAYIIQSVGSIASSLEMKDSLILSTLNITLPDNSSMEGVMDEAYSYGRSWISDTLRDTLEGTDSNVRQELEDKVLELWDRSYQYWILKQDAMGPKVSTTAITSSFGEILETVYHSREVFNYSSIEVFVRNNMGTLTSILEQVWSLFQGNFVFLLDTIVGLAKVLLHSGSGVINFMFGIVIYVTALFYLLSNSAATYKPIEFLGQYNILSAPGVGNVLQTAVNSVLFITLKMSSFYLLWTYLTHTVSQATIVVLPMLFSSFLAAVPFTGQYLVAVPASLELWLLQDRPLAAILLMIFQVAPSWLVDAAIYSEMKGGIHPWFTGLAVVGGVYVFGVVGAVYGPLVLCVLYVVVTLYTSYIQEMEPATPAGPAKSYHTPHHSERM
eukprot:TRINITY_DN8524_c0_g1_i10.p1 TRINITY_DN8524_c0_g1~~TRINITY_DN8524_c0_g1_i10.p1  ORF type:complete len:909 (-),score=164.41 TRINITY_DN8524_c0_g1_i10:305-3031(-)